MTCFARVVNRDVHLISRIKVETIKNGRKRRKKSLFPKQRGKLSSEALREEEKGDLQVSENKPEERVASAMQFMLFIRIVSAS